MPTPLPFIPTPSPQVAVTRGTDWGTLAIGLALGAVLTFVTALAGLGGGWLGWHRSRAKARAKAHARAAQNGHRGLPHSYVDFIAGADRAESGRASSTIDDQHDLLRGRANSAAAASPISEPEAAAGARRR
ncbi:hypothetical protein AURDEDRAFT_172657 [Auricularia subglabra TFB-10046 SS5]|nr:hypothetical protein AURDEDRAFT_172657 [Auricularia subglabra TFB-10046 SS5]